MKYYFLTPVFVLLVVSCSSPSDQSKENDQEEVAVAETESVSAATGRDAWVDFYKNLDPDFNPDNFSPLETNEISSPLECGGISAKAMPLYENLLVKSPDGSQYLDLFSYRYILEENADEIIDVMSDVDAEACLFNPGENKGYRLLFGGSSTDLEAAIWKTPETLTILGKETNDQGNWDLYMWVFDLSASPWQVTTFKYGGSIPPSEHPFVETIVFADRKYMLN